MLNRILFCCLFIFCIADKNFAQCGEEHLSLFGNNNLLAYYDEISLNSNFWYYEQGDSTLITWRVSINNKNTLPILIDSSLFPHKTYLEFSNDTLHISAEWAYIENDLKLMFNPYDTTLDYLQLNYGENYTFCTIAGTYKTADIKTIKVNTEFLFFFWYPELSPQISPRSSKYQFYLSLLSNFPTYQPIKDKKGEIIDHDWNWRYKDEIIWELRGKKIELYTED